MPKATHGGASNSWETPDLGEPEPIAPAVIDVQLPEITETTTEVETPAEVVYEVATDNSGNSEVIEAEPDATPEVTIDSSGNEEVIDSEMPTVDPQQEAIARARALLERYGA